MSYKGLSRTCKLEILATNFTAIVGGFEIYPWLPSEMIFFPWAIPWLEVDRCRWGNYSQDNSKWESSQLFRKWTCSYHWAYFHSTATTSTQQKLQGGKGHGNWDAQLVLIPKILRKLCWPWPAGRQGSLISLASTLRSLFKALLGSLIMGWALLTFSHLIFMCVQG